MNERREWLDARRDWLERIVGGRVRTCERVQSLWSGYGELVRLHLDAAPAPSVIVKWVEPPPPDRSRHPRGWSGRTSHERKLASYEHERRFYVDYASPPAAGHRTARCHAATRTETGSCLVLEDLDASGFAGRRGQDPGDDELTHCLAWLASFHAAHLGRAPEGLWPVGTYWHLATRQDELRAMRDDELRRAAVALDAQLRSARHRTIVHGDAKVANFCFGEHGVAAVDFQYVGGGPGIVDVAYLLGSCLDDDGCERHAQRHLDRYFELLRERLPAGVDAHGVCAEWRALYPAAWADYHRFLDGWAPDHWKIHRYTRRMTRLALGGLA